jgi:beta-lactamase regulating signal transducer with metallopeptidase domain
MIVELPHLVAEHLLKSTLVLALGFALVALIRRSNPAGKHGLWQCIFVAGLAIPLILMLPRWEIVPSWKERRAPEAVAPGAGRSISVLPADDYLPLLPPGNQAATTPPPENSFSLSALLLALWLAGVTALLLQSVAGHEFLRRLERQARPPGPRLRSQFERLRSVVGAERPVTLLLSPIVRSPFSWGIARPRILLPESAERWPESDLEMVLIHELEHVRRGDARGVLISRLFLALNWVNPLAWMAHRQSVRYREEACDEAVVREGHDSRDYADLLLRQARTASASALFSAATSVAEPGTVEGRVRRMLNCGGGRSNAPAQSTLAQGGALLAAAAAFAISSLGWRAVGSDDEDGKNTEKSEALTEQDTEEAKRQIEEKIKGIVIPVIDFKDTPFSEAIAILERKTAEIDPLAGGIRIRMVGTKDSTWLTMQLSNVPLMEALHYTSSLAQCKYRITGAGVEIVPLAELPLTSPDRLFTNIYRVPPHAFGTPPDGQNTKAALEKIGICFGEGSSASYNPESMNLIVRNTGEQLKRLEVHFPQGGGDRGGVKGEWFLSPEEAARVIAATEVIEKKMEQIILPGIEFADTPLSDALAFLEMRSATLDPLGEGVRFWLTERGGSKLAETRITLRSLNTPLSEALRDTTKLSRSTHRITENGVEIFPSWVLDPPPPGFHGLYTNIYSVPLEILSSNSEEPHTAREKLESMGITFGPGADAIFNPDTSRLTVRNTIDQMELVEAYLESVLPKASMNREGKASLPLMSLPTLREAPESPPTIESIIQHLPEAVSPLTAQQLDTKVPNSYYFDYAYPPQPGKRIWRRIDNETWHEIYPDGHTTVFKVLGHARVSDTEGTMVVRWREPNDPRGMSKDGGLQAFIPDLGSEKMHHWYRNTDRGDTGWRDLAPMKDVK